MDRRTTLRELDELIKRTQAVVARETALMTGFPRSHLRSERQQRVRAMRAQLRRLRNQRVSILATQASLLPKIA
jgi:hypothetical protein